MKRVFRNGNFVLLFSGNLVSQLGTTIYNFAIAWYLYLMEVDPVLIASYIATGLIVTLVMTPLAGVFIDRIDKVKVLYISDFIRGFTILGAGFIFFSGITLDQSIYLLFVCTIVLAINGAFFGPSASALIPEVVENNDIQSANATFSMVRSFNAIIGALLGAAFYEIVGIEMVFIINGVSYVLSAVSEMFIKRYYEKKEKEVLEGYDNELKKFFRELKEGFSFIIHREGMLAFMIAIVILNFSVAPLYTNATPYLFSTILKVDSYQLSYVNIGVSTGMLLGSIIMGSLLKNMPVRKAVIYGLVYQTIILSFVGILMILVQDNVLSYWVFFIPFVGFLFTFGIANMGVNIPLGTALIKVIDPEVRGRVLSVISFSAQIATPVAIIIGGFLLRGGTINGIIYFTVFFSVTVTIFFAMSKKIRHMLINLG